MTFAWTPHRIGLLCRRYAEGASFKEVGAELGCSKNAAIGKFNRLIKERHALALKAAAPRAGTADRVAAWMASYGGSVADCARSLGVSYISAKSAWDRVRARLGTQAR